MKKLMLFFVMSLSFSFFAHGKRLAPKPVKAVSNAGLRYEVIHWASDVQKANQNGGFIRVVNARDGVPICTKQVYKTEYDEKLEQDIQDNFITGLKIENGHLIVNSENLAAIKKPLANFCD